MLFRLVECASVLTVGLNSSDEFDELVMLIGVINLQIIQFCLS